MFVFVFVFVLVFVLVFVNVFMRWVVIVCVSEFRSKKCAAGSRC